MSTIRQKWGIASSASSSEFLAGMECEIEDLKGYVNDGPFWNVVEDGSLRNNGREFISIPAGKVQLLEQFVKLHESIVYSCPDKAVRFSPRTSIHVHVNCLDLEEAQVHDIVLWYALFEPIFFLLVDPMRKHNIHCVQLNQTTLSESYRRPLLNLHQRWSKYTALNLLPLNKYGTLEFRHMQGTDDVATVTGWLNALENLWLYGKSTPMDKKAIMSVENVQAAFYSIFKFTPEALKYSYMLPELLGDSLIDVKLSLL